MTRLFSPLLAAIAILAVFSLTAHAQQGGGDERPVPRFETIGSSVVNMRQGPGQDHTILWVFQGQRGLPVEVIGESNDWRQIRDPEDDTGWVHSSLLSRSRGVVVRGGMRSLRQRANVDAPIIAYLEARVVAELEECTPGWCRITVDGYTGWIRHDEIWGVYSDEVVR